MIIFRVGTLNGTYNEDEFIVNPGEGAQDLQAFMQANLDGRRRHSPHAHVGARALALEVLAEWGATILQDTTPAQARDAVH